MLKFNQKLYPEGTAVEIFDDAIRSARLRMGVLWRLDDTRRAIRGLSSSRRDAGERPPEHAWGNVMKG